MEKSRRETKKINLEKIKGEYFHQKLFSYTTKKKTFIIIKYNKKLQRKLKLNIKNYKDYYEEIEIEIIPIKNNSCRFINYSNDKQYYHIYFNDSNEEIYRNYIEDNEVVSKIKIIIDNKINSFKNLFKNCESIKSIYFKKFYRNNITDMNSMFNGCSSLIQLNINNFNTSNVTIMNGMFSCCELLTQLNLINFDTSNVTDMSYMFNKCSSLCELNISNFNTNKVDNMSYMFNRCSSLN